MSSCYDDIQPGQEHEVFLSFRGTDTRKGFTDYLFRSLFNAGVRVFRDNEKLHVGEEIGPQLVRGIRGSKISIPIFSRNYADSKWCLKEFTLMMDCRKTMNRIVLPIFYDVTPNEVQHQAGKFQEAFARHKDEYGADTVQQWKAALSEVGSLKGWELEKAADGHEAELVEIVVKEVMKKLKKAHIVLKDTVIGIEEQVNAVMQLLEVGANDFRALGQGSRIIVTTRDSGLFDKSRVKVYETKLMDTDRALQLFCSHAFKTYSPPSELRALSEDIVVKTGGLPLALEVIGGFLAGQEREV